MCAMGDAAALGKGEKQYKSLSSVIIQNAHKEI
jgi:hypothetical protein